jgi:hypothetical protein
MPTIATPSIATPTIASSTLSEESQNDEDNYNQLDEEDLLNFSEDEGEVPPYSLPPSYNSGLPPPYEVGPYEAVPAEANEIDLVEPINPSMEQPSSLSYAHDEDLSYRR